MFEGTAFLKKLRYIYRGPRKSADFWGERRQLSPNDACVIHCDLLAERDVTKVRHIAIANSEKLF